MRVFDLHCDTVLGCYNHKKELFKNDFQLDISRMSDFEAFTQVFACFLDDSLRGENAFEFFKKLHSLYMTEMTKNSDKITLYKSGNDITKGNTAILSVEGGHAIGGDLKNIELLKEMGVSFLTLVWNGDNEIASGVDGSGGVTEFGKQAIDELIKNNIIVDISHLNEHSADEVLERVSVPLVATHSNAYSVCPHVRNLQDRHFKGLIEKKGLCGINYFWLFVCEKENYELEALRRHMDHILSLGGEDILSLGSDFDGAPMPKSIGDVTGLYRLYDCVVKWYGDRLADKVFFGNASNFLSKNLIVR